MQVSIGRSQKAKRRERRKAHWRCWKDGMVFHCTKLKSSKRSSLAWLRVIHLVRTLPQWQRIWWQYSAIVLHVSASYHVVYACSWKRLDDFIVCVSVQHGRMNTCMSMSLAPMSREKYEWKCTMWFFVIIIACMYHQPWKQSCLDNAECSLWTTILLTSTSILYTSNHITNRHVSVYSWRDALEQISCSYTLIQICVWIRVCVWCNVYTKCTL